MEILGKSYRRVEMAQKRPLGIAILAIAMGLNNFYNVRGLFFVLSGESGLPGPFLGLTVAVFVAGIFGTISVAVGLWKLRNWARKAAIGIYGFVFLVLTIDLVSPFPFFGVVGRFFLMALCGLIVWYLFRPDVKKAFLNRDSRNNTNPS